MKKALKIKIFGEVQGVGFGPHLKSMLQAALQEIFSYPQGLMRKLCFTHCDRIVTQRDEKISATRRDTAHFYDAIVASDSTCRMARLRPRFAASQK